MNYNYMANRMKLFHFTEGVVPAYSMNTTRFSSLTKNIFVYIKYINKPVFTINSLCAGAYFFADDNFSDNLCHGEYA